MAVDTQFTPQPVQSLAPVRVAIADWHDLNANSNHLVFENNRFGDQVIDVLKVGGRPETSVDVQVEAEFTDARGSQTEQQTYESTAFGNFNNPVESGPVATDRFIWRTINRSGTGYTDAGGDPYQTFLEYAIRPMTIIEKLRRNFPLSSPERTLAEQILPGETLSVADRVQLNVPPEEDPAFQPNLDGKQVISTEAVTSTVDISATGTGNAVEIADERTRRDPTTGDKAETLYLTSLGINSQEFTEDDALQVQIVRDTTEEFARIKAFGQPGIGTGTGTGASVDGVSFPPYEAEWFVPFLDRMTVQVFTDGNAINNVDVRLEFARVERTLVEKALYNLEGQVRTDDPLASQRQELFDRIREKLQLGLPIELERQRAEEMAAT